MELKVLCELQSPVQVIVLSSARYSKAQSAKQLSSSAKKRREGEERAPKVSRAPSEGFT